MADIRKTRTVLNLDTGSKYVFTNKTPIEALQSMIYTLNLKSKCDSVINKTESGKCLYFDYKGETYSTINA